MWACWDSLPFVNGPDDNTCEDKNVTVNCMNMYQSHKTAWGAFA